MDNYLEKVKAYWLPLSLGAAGLIFLVYGLIGFSTPKKDKPDILFEAASDTRSASSGQDSPLVPFDSGTHQAVRPSAQDKHIAIDIEGAVQKPGVYQLQTDARVQDGLIAAGGLSVNADHDKVAKTLNLAAKLIDGGKIYIPQLGDAGSSIISDGSNVLGAQTSSTLNINSAAVKDLDSLPGIGEVTAQKIISGRPYGSVDELLSKKIVSSKVFAGIKDRVTVY